jgi:L-arabinose transport system ATP-binding protein
VLILDEPTRGVDVGAKADIYAIIDKLAAEGSAILVISSELPEVLGLADRIIVMQGGRVTGELSREEASEEKVLALAIMEDAL